jgi:hypothetical protein
MFYWLFFAKKIHNGWMLLNGWPFLRFAVYAVVRGSIENFMPTFIDVKQLGAGRVAEQCRPDGCI